jgi:hypothetical protein
MTQITPYGRNNATMEVAPGTVRRRWNYADSKTVSMTGWAADVVDGELEGMWNT